MQSPKRILQRIKLIGALLVGALLFTGCSNAVFEQNQDIPSAGWHKDSVYVFESDSLTDLPKAIEIGYSMRNTIDYKYRDFWSFITIELPSGKILKDSLFHTLLTKEGFWKEGVEGDNAIKESQKFFPHPINNPDPGRYKITIEQGMRDEVLMDIISISALIREYDLSKFSND